MRLLSNVHDSTRFQYLFIELLLKHSQGYRSCLAKHSQTVEIKFCRTSNCMQNQKRLLLFRRVKLCELSNLRDEDFSDLPLLLILRFFS